VRRNSSRISGSKGVRAGREAGREVRGGDEVRMEE
jgi:hypothetical protein